MREDISTSWTSGARRTGVLLLVAAALLLVSATAPAHDIEHAADAVCVSCLHADPGHAPIAHAPVLHADPGRDERPDTVALANDAARDVTASARGPPVHDV